MHKSILRGDIYYADLNPVVGSEQGGVRPVLVLQNDIGNKHSTTIIVAAITGKATKTILPTHYLLAALNGLDRDSIVLLEQIRTIDKSRLRYHIGQLDDVTMQGIDRTIVVSMGIEL